MRREISGGSAHPSGRRLPLPVDRDPLHRPERISPLPPRTCIQGRGLLMRKRTIVQRTDRDGVAGPIPSQNGGSDRATDRFASPEAMSQHALRPRLRIADLDPDPEAHLDEGGALVGALLGALAPEPGELWLLRPDAHIAAVLDDVADLRAAVDRLLAR